MGKAKRRYDILVAFLVFLAAFLAEKAEFFAVIEDQAISMRQQLRLAYGHKEALRFSPEIVLVNTDEKFFSAYGSWPLRREDIGKLVLNLKNLGAKVVAVGVDDRAGVFQDNPVFGAAGQIHGNRKGDGIPGVLLGWVDQDNGIGVDQGAGGLGIDRVVGLELGVEAPLGAS